MSAKALLTELQRRGLHISTRLYFDDLALEIWPRSFLSESDIKKIKHYKFELIEFYEIGKANGENYDGGGMIIPPEQAQKYGVESPNLELDFYVAHGKQDTPAFETAIFCPKHFDQDWWVSEADDQEQFCGICHPKVISSDWGNQDWA